MLCQVVTLVLALNHIAGLICCVQFELGAFLLLCEFSQEICKRNLEIPMNFYMKAIIYA